MVLCGTANNPPDVSPPASVARRVRITLLVCMRVMNSVCCYPLDWPTFQRKDAARYKKVFHDPGYVITAVGKQSMKSHADSETAGDPVENHGANERRPAPKEKRRNRTSMSYNQKNSVAPVDGLVGSRSRGSCSFIHSFFLRVRPGCYSIVTKAFTNITYQA